MVILTCHGESPLLDAEFGYLVIGRPALDGPGQELSAPPWSGRTRGGTPAREAARSGRPRSLWPPRAVVVRYVAARRLRGPNRRPAAHRRLRPCEEPGPPAATPKGCSPRPLRPRHP